MNTEIFNDFEKFKSREVKAKQIFKIIEIPKNVAYDFVKQYHYLEDAKFFSKFAYGLYCRDELVGCATYTNPQGTEAMKCWFSLGNSDQSILELSRLCMLPQLNGTNATSYLLGNSMKLLNKEHQIRAIITLADASRHIGSIYQVCNFKYYGLSGNNKDFFRFPDCKKNPRGKPSEWQGVYLPRSRKHRYAYIFDKTLKCNLKEQDHPRVKGETIFRECCSDRDYVYDNRYNRYYTCPHCYKKLDMFNSNFKVYDKLMDIVCNGSFNLENYINANINCIGDCQLISYVYKLSKYNVDIYEKFSMLCNFLSQPIKLHSFKLIDIVKDFDESKNVLTCNLDCCQIYDKLMGMVSEDTFDLESYINQNSNNMDVCMIVSFVYKLSKYDCNNGEKLNMFCDFLFQDLDYDSIINYINGNKQNNEEKDEQIKFEI